MLKINWQARGYFCGLLFSVDSWDNMSGTEYVSVRMCIVPKRALTRSRDCGKKARLYRKRPGAALSAPCTEKHLDVAVNGGVHLPTALCPRPSALVSGPHLADALPVFLFGNWKDISCVGTHNLSAHTMMLRTFIGSGCTTFNVTFQRWNGI